MTDPTEAEARVLAISEGSGHPNAWCPYGCDEDVRYLLELLATEREKVRALVEVLTDMANDTMQSRTTENGIVTSWWLPGLHVDRLFKAWERLARDEVPE